MALVSECMLQQTQVSRVLDYFAPFLARFPNVKALAEADEQEVLALWQGLGYYRRARHLQAAARLIIDEFDGVIPRDVESLQRLPGIGRYTAGAIASIAFNEPAAIVDGNVARVLARLLLIDEPVDGSATQRVLWSKAEELVRLANEPGQFNQALMELGSTVCLPQSPRCDQCPVSEFCAARAGGCVDRVPRPKKPVEQKRVYAATVIIARHGRLFLTQRPENGLWSSMWEAPTIESTKRIPVKKLAPHLAEQFKLQIDGLKKVVTFTHHTSHREFVFNAYFPRNAIRGRARRGKWIDRSDLSTVPISNAQRRLLREFLDT